MTRITVRTTKIAITRRISLVTLICAPSFLNVSEILCPVRMDRREMLAQRSQERERPSGRVSHLCREG